MRILAVIVTIGCIAAIIFGSIHWKQKIASIHTDEVISTQKIENTQDIKGEEVEESSKKSEMKMEEITSSLPSEAASIIHEAKENGKTVELLILGSEANTMGERTWPVIFKERMDETYGELVAITAIEIPNVTTLDVVNGNLHMELISDIRPDIVILEPFMLNDNGTVILEQTLENIKSIILDIKSLNESALFFLQAPHPVPNAINYPLEIEELKKLADEEGHYFIDHWTNWPDYNSEEIYSYVLEGSVAPTELGHEVWAEYIVELFINQDID